MYYVNSTWLPCSILLLCTTAVLVLPPAFSQTETAATSPDVARGGSREYLFKTVKLSGSLRTRWESTHGSDFSVTPASSYLLTRARLALSFHPAAWFQIAGEAQDARALFYGTTPSGSVRNPIDLRQAYVQMGTPENGGVMVRVGRQELTLGSGRLIASLDWSNTARLFDVARAQLGARKFKLDLVGGSIVQTDPDRIDRHKPGEHFYSAYGALPALLPAASIEPYLVVKTQLSARGKDGLPGDAETFAFGARAIGKAPGRFDYSVEAVREAGNYSNDTLRAFGFIGAIGWTIANSGWRPHISAEYTYASGDDGRKDQHRESFDNMYGYNNPTNSLTGLFGWRNLSEWRTGMDVRPLALLKVKIDFRNFALANNQDGLYNSSGSRTVFNPMATSTHVGYGIDTQVVLALSKATSLGVGLGTLSPGEYLRQSGKTTGFLYPYLYLSRGF